MKKEVESGHVKSGTYQTQFLAKPAQRKLSFLTELQKAVSEIILPDQGADRKLHATGSKNGPGKGIGWWAGWVQKDDRVYSFALNMDILTLSDGGKRNELGRASPEEPGLPPKQ